MICTKCGANTNCRTAKVYYAQILTVNQSTRNGLLSSQTTTTTTYTSPKSRDVPICLDCIAKLKRRNLLLTPLFVLIGSALFAGIVGADQLLLELLGAIWLLVVVTVIIILVRKKYKTRISEMDVYTLASAQLKKQLQGPSSKIKYAFWQKYPSHLKPTR